MIYAEEKHLSCLTIDRHLTTTVQLHHKML